MNLIELLLLFSVISMSLLALDDFTIDILRFIYKAHPQKLTLALKQTLLTSPQKNIAILVANWKEEDVIEHMVLGNLQNVDYQNFHFFLGVYPNDAATLAVAKRLSEQHPRVHAVINPKPGPTSKGQMLNVVARQIFSSEESLKISFDIFLMHDSEDVIHPLSLPLINTFINNSDFIQIPVYSFDRSLQEIIGNTYSDEFSEHHTGEMLLRSKMGLVLPSAGTGTALSRRLMLKLMEVNKGGYLRESALTEDYFLGHSVHLLKMRALFLCFYENQTNNQRNFIATREYFPNSIKASIKQKTRWSIGIIFQGIEFLGWNGSPLNKYFLWRDRRGLINSFVVTFAFMFLIFFAYRQALGYSPLSIENNNWFNSLLIFNFFAFIIRIYHRMFAVYIVHNLKTALMTPVRWWLANFINTVATYRALMQYTISKSRNKALSWSKTEHSLPAHFKAQADLMAQNMGVVLSNEPQIKGSSSNEITNQS